MTTNQISTAIGKIRHLVVRSSSGNASMLVPVTILDARSQFGRIDAMITPAGGGSGSIWVSLESLSE